MGWVGREALWLNVTNALLGVAVLGVVSVLLVAIVSDLLARHRGEHRGGIGPASGV